MNSANELGSSVWDAVKLSFGLVWDFGRNLSKMETDPTAKGLMQIFFLMAAPLAMVIAALIAVIWFLLKKAYNAMQG